MSTNLIGCCYNPAVAFHAACQEVKPNFKNLVNKIPSHKVNPGRLGYVKKLVKQNRVTCIEFSTGGWDKFMQEVTTKEFAVYHWKISHQGDGQRGDYFL